MDTSQVTPPIQITEKALEKLREALQTEQNAGIRVGVAGGGCSGYQWVLDVDDSPGPMDFTFDFNGVRVYIDPMSAPYLQGTTVDYIETLMTQGFTFVNESVKRTCGCGKSVAY